MKKILGRVAIVLPAILLQGLWYCMILKFLDNLFLGYLGYILNIILSVLAVIFVSSLVTKRDESSYKLLWVIVILSMPILGALLYFWLGNKNTGKRLKKKINQSSASPPKLREEGDKNLIADIKATDLRIGQTLKHITDATGFPIVKNEVSKYYSFGEEMFRDMCKDLKKAKKYVYVEYFIIESGIFWDNLSDIMAQKVKEGVDVRVMYDDLGSIKTYSIKDIKDLYKKGIKCIPFNPFLFIKSQLNNRDHRKIMVIDGEIAYSGGINLADEYINEKKLYGKWKDIGFRITGLRLEAMNICSPSFGTHFRMTK